MQHWLATGTHASTTRKKRQSPGKSILYIAFGASYYIDSFLSYPILQFTTISLQIRLSSRPLSPDPELFRSPFDRIPRNPLCSALGEVVGSLHPENLDLILAPGTAIEILMIIPLSFKLTVGSALLQLHPADRVSNLFWVVYVT
jgi:hypothetical protein